MPTVIPSARTFNRIFYAFCGIKHSTHFIIVTLKMKSIFRAWLDFIRNLKGSLNLN